MNIRFVIKIISILLFILSLIMVIPAAMAVYFREFEEFKGFAISIIFTILITSIILYLMRKVKIDFLSTRDGFLFVSAGWIAGALIGALPFFISGAIPSYSDSFFETMSGFSTTGASILTNIEGLPRSLLFWRSLTHWLGGMGIVVLTVAILPLLSIGGLQLIKAEAPGPSVDKLTPRVTETAKRLWYLYCGFTVAETLLLMTGGMDLFDALTHTFGTLATGGFSTKNSSIGHYNSAYIDYVITFFMIMAGINFSLHFKVISGRFRSIWKDAELKTYLSIFLLATIIITISLYRDYFTSFGKSLRYASFQVATMLTTTGYATDDFEKWPLVCQVILFMLMFVGGSSGSTGGGIKVIRLITLFKQGLVEMKNLLHPRGVFILKISGKVVGSDIIRGISGFFFLYIFILLLVSLVVATSGQGILTSFTTALATVGNIGPGFGKIGPTDNYAFYPYYVKWFLSFAMLVGRLELYTVLILFTPRFWKR